MLWSSLPAIDMPAPGDLVATAYDAHPWRVEQRIKDQWGQVHLRITRGQTELWERVECLSWYPTKGDICTIILQPYIQWVQAQIDWKREVEREENPMRWQAIDAEIEALKKQMGLVNECGSWLYQDLLIVGIEHNWATVQSCGFDVVGTAIERGTKNPVFTPKGQPQRLPAQAIGVIYRARAMAMKQLNLVAA